MAQTSNTIFPISHQVDTIYPVDTQVSASKAEQTANTLYPSAGVVSSNPDLIVQHNGGRDLNDRYGPLPTVTVVSQDIIIDPYTGEWIQVENGWVESDTVGDHEPYIGGIGRSDGAIKIGAGSPASQRRSGLDSMSFTDYIQVTLSGDAHSFISRAEIGPVSPSSENPFFGIDASGYRWGIQILGENGSDARLFDNSTVKATATISGASAFAAGNTITIAGSQDSEATATTQIIGWEEDGTEINRDSDTFNGSVTSLAGEYAIGRGRAGGDFVNGNVLVWGGADGSALTFAELETLETSVRSTTNADTLATSHPTLVWSDGITPGVYSRIATEKLLGLSGSGSKPTVEVAPSTPISHTQPQDIASLMTDHDALRGATYNGSNITTGIYDYSGNDYHLEAASPAASTQQTVEMLGRNVYLPSPITTIASMPVASFTETVTDFTVICLIPMDGTPGGADYYYTMNQASGWAIRVGTPIANTQQIYLVNNSGAAVSGTEMLGVFNSSNGPAAHMIVVFRRSVGDAEITCDAWYDQDLGSGVQKVAQRVAVDTFSSSLSITGAAALGRNGSSSGSWQGAGLCFHRGMLFKETLSDSNTLAIIKGQAARLGWDPDLITL